MNVGLAAGAASGGFALLLALLVMFLCIRRKRTINTKQAPSTPEPRMLQGTSHITTHFTTPMPVPALMKLPTPIHEEDPFWDRPYSQATTLSMVSNPFADDSIDNSIDDDLGDGDSDSIVPLPSESDSIVYHHPASPRSSRLFGDGEV